MRLVLKCGVFRLVVVMGEGSWGWSGGALSVGEAHYICTAQGKSHRGYALSSPPGTTPPGNNLSSPPHHCQFYDFCDIAAYLSASLMFSNIKEPLPLIQTSPNIGLPIVALVQIHESLSFNSSLQSPTARNKMKLPGGLAYKSK